MSESNPNPTPRQGLEASKDAISPFKSPKEMYDYMVKQAIEVVQVMPLLSVPKVVLDPAPRYDDAYFDALEVLDKMASGEIEDYYASDEYQRSLSVQKD